VLRGDKSRFQLFGDTMNVASRIETTGERNKIHVSAEMGALLMDAGEGHWLTERDSLVAAKGKGILKTYWLDIRAQSSPSTRSGNTDSSEGESTPLKSSNVPADKASPEVTTSLFGSGETVSSQKIMRLVTWNCELLAKLLKQIKARRMALGTKDDKFQDPEDHYEGGSTIIKEVKDIITLPRFNNRKDMQEVDPDKKLELHPAVIKQLREFVTTIASLYHSNPFHVSNNNDKEWFCSSVGPQLTRVVVIFTA